MTTIVTMLHDPSSMMMDMLLQALKAGKLVVVDVSQLRGDSALILSGLVLQRIFDHNQEEFTRAVPETIPTIAVVEEAQSVLSESAAAGEGPYVTWVKEGRKYDLGALLVTQQPGSISWQILSQGDNWFVFHLLSSGDLGQLKRANAHFSDDILSSLLNEPIPGNGVFWSSAGGKAYPIPIRVLLFEDVYHPLDPKYERAAGTTYAMSLRSEFESVAQELWEAQVSESKPGASPGAGQVAEDELQEAAQGKVDLMAAYRAASAAAIRNDVGLNQRLKGNGEPWRGLVAVIERALPSQLDTQEKNKLAYDLVSIALQEIFGRQDEGWHTEKRPAAGGRPGTTTWVKIGPAPPVDSEPV